MNLKAEINLRSLYKGYWAKVVWHWLIHSCSKIQRLLCVPGYSVSTKEISNKHFISLPTSHLHGCWCSFCPPQTYPHNVHTSAETEHLISSEHVKYYMMPDVFAKSTWCWCLCSEVIFSVGILNACSISISSSEYDSLFIATKIYWKPYYVSGSGAKHFTSVI